MANATVRDAKWVHSTNPQFLIDQVLRTRIYGSRYWKEQCFALDAASVLDRAVALQAIGGTVGATQKPSPFLALTLKLLQLQPQREIVLEYLGATEFKYLQALAALYIRLTFSAFDIYDLLEPLLEDYRKLRYAQQSGSYTLTHMDEFVDQLLSESWVCDITLPRLPRRSVVEENEGLPPRISPLEDALLAGAGSGDESDASGSERRERKQHLRRAKALRKELERQKASQAKMQTEQPEDDEEDYPSQEISSEEEDAGYISRSPSRSVSPDRVPRPPEDEDAGYRSRSPSHSPDRMSYRSRSPSRSPDREGSPGYQSRSPSRSPGR